MSSWSGRRAGLHELQGCAVADACPTGSRPWMRRQVGTRVGPSDRDRSVDHSGTLEGGSDDTRWERERGPQSLGDGIDQLWRARHQAAAQHDDLGVDHGGDIGCHFRDGLDGVRDHAACNRIAGGCQLEHGPRVDRMPARPPRVSAAAARQRGSVAVGDCAAGRALVKLRGTHEPDRAGGLSRAAKRPTVHEDTGAQAEPKGQEHDVLVSPSDACRSLTNGRQEVVVVDPHRDPKVVLQEGRNVDPCEAGKIGRHTHATCLVIHDSGNPGGQGQHRPTIRWADRRARQGSKLMDQASAVIRVSGRPSYPAPHGPIEIGQHAAQHRAACVDPDHVGSVRPEHHPPCRSPSPLRRRRDLTRVPGAA